MEDRLHQFRLYTLTTLRARTCFAVPRLGAVSSVACLEWSFVRDNGSDALGVLASTRALCYLKSALQKRLVDKTFGENPRLYIRYLGIAVWTMVIRLRYGNHSK